MLSGRAKGVLIGIAFLIVVGALLNISELFVMATGLIAVMGTAYIMARIPAARIQVEEEIPDLVAAGQIFDVRLNINSRMNLTETRYDVNMNLPDGIEWLGLEEQKQTHNTSFFRYRMKALYRGIFDIGVSSISVQDPLGLFSLKVRSKNQYKISAWPEPVDPSLSMSLVQRSGSMGLEESTRKSRDGTSIHGVRPWAPGDAVRHVHWPSTARLGKLAVMEFEAEASNEVVLVMDTWRKWVPDEGEWDDVFEIACGVTSYYLHNAWKDNQRVSLTVGKETVLSAHGPMGQMQRRDALGLLARAKADRNIQPEEIVEQVMSSNRHPGMMLYVTTRWDTETQTTLASCGMQSCPVVAVVILDGSKPKLFENARNTETAGEGCTVYILNSDEFIKE